MKKALPLGIMDYSILKNNDYYAVDKSMMIQEFLESKRMVTLITRPRRFGKTLNMSMMSTFFDITKNSSELFEHTAILNTEYACEMNQWPVIFITFANAKGSKRQLIETIKSIIRDEYERYSYVFSNLSLFEQFDYKNIVESLMNKEENLDYVENSLAFLMKILEKYYHKKVMVFIDEYDTPFIEAHVNGFYQEIKNGLSSLLHNALKTSTSLQYAMMTGIQRVAKENIFSDLNNLVVCTVRDDEYSQYFGFTTQEVKSMLENYDMELSKEVTMMYDGYHIGKSEIYNPWSIINYVQRGKLEPYWINTSSNTIIRNAIKNSDLSFKRTYEELITNDYLDTSVLMETSFFEQSETRSLWGLFINAGYLTIEKEFRNNYYRLRIPNEEVRNEFKSLTSYYLNVKDMDFENLYTAFESSKKELFIETYQRLLLTLPSIYDLKDENSYHMMVLGLCAWMKNLFEIKSNREEGLGRCDIILKSKIENVPSYIMEFKYSKEACDLEALAESAVKQIFDKKYDADLEGNIIYIGLAHFGKNVKVYWKNK